DNVPRYRDRTAVAIFIGDGDLPACKAESEEAVAWYMARNFRVVRGKMIDSMSHRRIPQTAAAFFAEQIGGEPLRPLDAAKTVSYVHMVEYYPEPELVAKMSPSVSVSPSLAARTTPPGNSAAGRHTSGNYANTTAGRNYPFDQPVAQDGSARG